MFTASAFGNTSNALDRSAAPAPAQPAASPFGMAAPPAPMPAQSAPAPAPAPAPMPAPAPAIAGPSNSSSRQSSLMLRFLSSGQVKDLGQYAEGSGDKPSTDSTKTAVIESLAKMMLSSNNPDQVLGDITSGLQQVQAVIGSTVQSARGLYPTYYQAYLAAAEGPARPDGSRPVEVQGVTIDDISDVMGNDVYNLFEGFRRDSENEALMRTLSQYGVFPGAWSKAYTRKARASEVADTKKKQKGSPWPNSLLSRSNNVVEGVNAAVFVGSVVLQAVLSQLDTKENPINAAAHYLVSNASLVKQAGFFSELEEAITPQIKRIPNFPDSVARLLVLDAIAAVMPDIARANRTVVLGKDENGKKQKQADFPNQIILPSSLVKKSSVNLPDIAGDIIDYAALVAKFFGATDANRQAIAKQLDAKYAAIGASIRTALAKDRFPAGAAGKFIQSLYFIISVYQDPASVGSYTSTASTFFEPKIIFSPGFSAVFNNMTNGIANGDPKSVLKTSLDFDAIRLLALATMSV